MIEVTGKGDIIYVKRHKVAVIKRGLDAQEISPLTEGTLRVSHRRILTLYCIQF
jgi:hypothetical protein